MYHHFYYFIIIIMIIFFFFGGGGSENLIFMEKADFVNTFFGLISMHLQGFP